jgi:type 1 glutamine amidotransferase
MTRRLLVFTRTCGYRHDSIPAAVAAVTAMTGVQARHSEDPAALHDLTRTDAVLFLSTTGDVLEPVARAALRTFVLGGGGFVGVHSAAGTEITDPWYGELLGARFRGHPRGLQRATMTVLPGGEKWEFTDEWYAFDELRDDLELLVTVDEDTYEPGDLRMPAPHPQAWHRRVGSGRSWYTALGHSVEAWSDDTFLAHVRSGIDFATRAVTPSG